MTLLSVKEVGQLLGLDRATIASWNHADRLPKPEWVVSGGTTPVWTEQTIKDWASSDEFVQPIFVVNQFHPLLNQSMRWLNMY